MNICCLNFFYYNNDCHCLCAKVEAWPELRHLVPFYLCWPQSLCNTHRSVSRGVLGVEKQKSISLPHFLPSILPCASLGRGETRLSINQPFNAWNCFQGSKIFNPLSSEIHNASSIAVFTSKLKSFFLI